MSERVWVSESAVPATKSALRGSPSTAGSPQVLRLPRNLHFEVHQALYPPRNLHFEVHTSVMKSTLRGSQSAVPATKSANEPRVQKSRFTAPVRKSELLDDHRHVQSVAPATKTALRSKTAPIPCACHEKSPKHEVSLAPATKKHHHVRKCARHHNESAVARSTRRPPRFRELAQSKCTSTISTGMNVV